MIEKNVLLAHVNQKENPWIARINSVNGDQVIVTISEDDGEEHHAIWKHSEIKEQLENKELYIVGRCHDKLG